MNMAASVELADLMQLLIPDDDDAIQKAYRRTPSGFPSPAGDNPIKCGELNSFLFLNKLATFSMRAVSESMIDGDIGLNDILVVDRSLNPRNTSIVIAEYNDDLIVRRFIQNMDGKSSAIWLKADNPKYSEIHPKEGDLIIIWGVVTRVIKNTIV
jgi:DNA polymerase V